MSRATDRLDAATLQQRWGHLRTRLVEAGFEGLIVNGGPDLLYLTGHHARSFERLTALVGRVDDETPTLMVPQLERAGVHRIDEAFSIITWHELEDPAGRLLDVLGDAASLAVSDDLWGMHVLSLVRTRPDAELSTVSEAIGGIRVVKTPDEIDALRRVGRLADQVMEKVQAGEIRLVGRSEAEIAADIGENLLAVGHQTVEFVIVASGPNSASPHHWPGDRIVEPNEMVLFDFGGNCDGYNSDTTRCVFTGPVPDEVAAAYGVLHEAQQQAFEAAAVGGRLCDVDSAARSVIAEAGYGEAFIHRTGHGIGVEVHEPPYVTGANEDPILVGHAFSIEPGIYIDGEWGMRLEDIVVIGSDGRAIRCNNSRRDLVSVN